MNRILRSCIAAVMLLTPATVLRAENGPFEGSDFRGSIAYSADGNHNDPDDWAASPVSLAILAESGLRKHLVHFHYNCILPLTDSEWEKKHAESVLGAAKHYGYDESIFFDCRKELDKTVADISRMVNESSADNPLYFIVAGPMQVPVMGILKSDPAKRKHVYCISHSNWNDGLVSRYKFTHTKRDVIETGVNWVQIQGQNRLLAQSRYGAPAKAEEFEQYFWMRDSRDPKVKFLWERMVVSTRPDPSDAGMTYFLVSGDEFADPAKLKQLISDHVVPAPITARPKIRLEAENFVTLDGCQVALDDRRITSHGVIVKSTKAEGRISSKFREPYSKASTRYDVEVSYLDEQGQRPEFAFSVNDVIQGSVWKALGTGNGWTTRTIQGVAINAGDDISVESSGGTTQLDYVQLNDCTPEVTASSVVSTKLDDPDALPGQIIVAGSKPGYLKYNGGGFAYLCGPDNPEEFLFLGDLNPDGTRANGQQQLIIDRMVEAGVSACHMMMFRMRRCNIKDEGDDQHCPFVDFDPAKPLNEKVLDQWDGWLKQMEGHGIVVHLEFYNDATDVERMGWALKENGNLHPDEERFFAGIVTRFKHRKNIIWGIEESVNKLPRERTPHFMKLSELIARVDNHHHPIVHSFVSPDTSERDLGADKIMSDEYIADPNIHIVTWLHALPHGDDYEAQHQEYLKYARMNNDRFIVMKGETERFPRTQPQSRRYMWSCVMTGMHALESYHNALKTPQLLADDGRIRKFMEQTDFHTMRSRDELAIGSTKWILANSDKSYIAYTYDYAGPMGIKGITAGRYDFTWFDTVNGRALTQSGVTVSTGAGMWNKPESFGTEIVLYVKPSSASK